MLDTFFICTVSRINLPSLPSMPGQSFPSCPMLVSISQS
nr:MAG TPA: hypothetical protein [Caudoviricetes sp.]